MHGIPLDMDGAHRLFEDDPHDCQLWALTLVDGQPRDGGKRGADKGVDGLILYQHDRTSDRSAVVSVKGGKNLNPGQVRDLIGTMHNQGADLGVMITLHSPTQQMKHAAAEAGSMESGGRDRPKVQIRTIEQLMAGFKPDLPPIYDIISAAAAARRTAAKRPPKSPTPEQIREQPSLKLPFEGGRASNQDNLPLGEELLVFQPAERPAGRKRKA